MSPLIIYPSSDIQHIQNLLCIGISFLTTGTIIIHTFYPIDYFIYKLFAVVFIHCFTDLFLTKKPDIIIHHLIVMSMSSFMYIKQIPMEIASSQAIVTLSLEISTVFLVGRDYINKQYFLSTINNICFGVSFMYLRIYLLISYLFLDEKYQYYINNNITTIELVWYNISIYSFLLLNLYWGMIILKSSIKSLRSSYSHLFTYKIAEYGLQFTYILSPFISLYAYSGDSTNEIKSIIIIDLFGQAILSTNSYYYHNTIYNNLIKNDGIKNDGINILDKNIYKTYINDILSIHIRSLLCVIVNLYSIETPYTAITILSYLLFIHLLSLFYFYDDILMNINSNNVILYAGKDRGIDYIIRIPIVIEILIIIFHSNNYIACNHNIIALLSIALLLSIKPFYELNHFILHILLLYQTYGLSVCNNSVLE